MLRETMSTGMKQIIESIIVGALVMHAIGFLIFDVATVEFYAANASPADLSRENNLQWSIALGNLSLATLLALVIAGRSETPSVAQGLSTGAIVGLLVWLGVDFTFYGYEERWNLALTITDPMLAAIQMGLAGAIIAAIQGRTARSAGAPIRE